jgi:hypothetical protein
MEVKREKLPGGAERVTVRLDTQALVEKYGLHVFKIGDETTYMDYSNVSVENLAPEPSVLLAEKMEKKMNGSTYKDGGADALRMECDMLRRFFDCWENLHAIPNEHKNKHKSEQAAQLLVDTAYAIRAFRAGGHA